MGWKGVVGVERQWKAQAKQSVFLQREEDEALYGGAAGAGKTDALLVFSIQRRVAHPGSRGLLVRRTFADLGREGAAIPRSHALLAGTEAQWVAGAHKWRFANGSVLEFGAIGSDRDVYKYQGSQYDDLCFDELTQFTEFQYHFLLARVRTALSGLRPLVRAATNPGGIGHGWVKARFITCAPPLTPYHDPATSLSRVFVPARVHDNAALLDADPGYLLRLLALPEAARRAYLDGDWDVFSGQVFREFRQERGGRPWHVVTPFAIPADWRRFRALDFGIGAPMCCLWFARDPAGGVVVYRELYGPGMTAGEQARRIVELTGAEKIGFTKADPAIWSRGADGRSIAAEYAARGLPCQRADNNRLSGKARVHEFLAGVRDDGAPLLRVFSSCLNLIRTLPSLVYDPHHVEDVDTGGEDHAYDALRYGLMAVATRPLSGEQAWRARRL